MPASDHACSISLAFLSVRDHRSGAYGELTHRPVEGDLPATDLTHDGCYVMERDGLREVAHVEFYRRHQGLDELALDIGETQVRLRRKENAPVYSLLWDLYGSRKDPVVQMRTCWIGRKGDKSSSQIVYLRVNLRGMKAAQLLEDGPKTLYPLVPLTSDGAQVGQVRQAMAAIEQRTDLGPQQQADHLAILRFLAEAEDVPADVLDFYFTKEKMMQSSLYQRIFAEGRNEGRNEGRAEDLLQILAARLGPVAPEVRQIIHSQAESSPELLSVWFTEAALAADAEAAMRLVRKITAT